MTTATTHSFTWKGAKDAPLMHTTTWLVHPNGNREELSTVTTLWPTNERAN
jgi:hypothetical protein